ncbi:MAG: hypothetical protein G01um101470_606 [Parcubacteria group bacterium Gr01-1014_70]|nr:MAG: hypothetical protein G01um101470_606 [Parcubacteria group bacterium Gr01-1014_70]
MTVGQIGQGSVSDKIFLTVLRQPLRFIGGLVVLLMVVGWETGNQQLFTAGLSVIWFAAIIFGSTDFCNKTSLGRRLVGYSWKLTSILMALIAFVLLVEVAAPLSTYLWHGEWCGLTCVLRGE